MRKLLLLFFIFIIHGTSFLQAQQGCNKIKFDGQAPAIWSVDGQINDWETILGQSTGDPLAPFNPPASLFNYFTETFDFDTPDPQRDLRSFAFTHDDYNVYFYFRRVQNGNAQNTFFYFFDINLDGLMSLGEPVVYANFNSKNISPIAIGSYIPNTAIDYNVAGQGNYMAHPLSLDRCFVNGYAMQGDVSELFNSSSIPPESSLQEHEVFAAAITEDGYGVEFAVPWRYLKNWVSNTTPLNPLQQRDLFAYRISLQGGAGKYQPHKVTDNAGGNDCGVVFPISDLAISGFPDFSLQSSSVQVLSPGSFRITLSYQNLRNVVEFFDLGDIVLENIQATPGSTANVSGFIINAYIDKNCNQLIDADERANRYFYDPSASLLNTVTYIGGPDPVSVDVMQTICLIIDIQFPNDNSITSAQIQFNPKASIKVITNCACDGCSPLDGGKPINPIGFDLGLEEETSSNKNFDVQTEQTRVNAFKISVYPNPSTANANIVLPADGALYDIRLSDYSGRMIRNWSGMRQQLVKIQNLKPGFYLLTITRKTDNKILTKKIIIE
jgi:hypothetical protein